MISKTENSHDDCLYMHIHLYTRPGQAQKIEGRVFLVVAFHQFVVVYPGYKI